MATRRSELTKLYYETTDKASSNLTEWTGLLSVMGRMYKYPFHQQLMIYAQKPDATACATWDTWGEKMGRYIQRGTTGIGLIDPTNDNAPITYVFDVSNTGTREYSKTPVLSLSVIIVVTLA